MQSITTLAEAEKVLAQYIPLSRKVTGKDITLARMGPLMNLLGNPQHKLTIIHIAGTSGKTSTTYYISALLIASGKKVGTTISPYIDTITERFQINLSPLEESEFALYLSTFLDIIDKAQLKPTYFELLIAFAYWYFVQVGVDYAVIETGLGGLQDSTNIADNPNKICVITDIGYDHMEILGHTIQEIAKQKAGIIHPHNVALMYHQSDAVIGEFQDWCGNVGAELHFHNQEELEERFIAPTVLGGLPLFQRRNFLLAFEAYKTVQKRDRLPDIRISDFKKVLALQIPGRMETRVIGMHTVVMDGAHNGQKMQAFVSSFSAIYPTVKADLLLSFKRGKEYMDVLPILLPLTRKLIICEYSLTQNRHLQSTSAEELALAARTLGFTDVTVKADCAEAYIFLLEQNSHVKIITGSFYLISELKHRFKELQ